MAHTYDLSKAEVLIALYCASKPFGMGALHAREGGMSVEEATARVSKTDYFDYLLGRLMKVNLGVVEIYHDVDEMLYDRDLGRGAAQRAIDDYYTTPVAEREAYFHKVLD